MGKRQCELTFAVGEHANWFSHFGIVYLNVWLPCGLAVRLRHIPLRKCYTCTQDTCTRMFMAPLIITVKQKQPKCSSAIDGMYQYGVFVPCDSVQQWKYDLQLQEHGEVSKITLSKRNKSPKNTCSMIPFI